MVVKDTWWGIIALEDHVQSRVMPSVAMGALNMVARLLGAAVSHERQEQAMLRSSRLEATAALAAEGRPIPAELSPPDVPHGAGRILLVDDEQVVLRSAARMLEHLGYETVTAEGGEQAITALEERGPMDLVLLDMAMPDMDGGEVFAALRAIEPALQVLVCSGYDRGKAVEELIEAGAVGFLQKPFSLASLSEALASYIPTPDA